MPLEIVNNGDSGLLARTKINNAITTINVSGGGATGPTGPSGAGVFYYQNSAPVGSGTGTIESGSFWYNSDIGNLYVYVNDGSTYQWVTPVVYVSSSETSRTISIADGIQEDTYLYGLTLSTTDSNIFIDLASYYQMHIHLPNVSTMTGKKMSLTRVDSGSENYTNIYAPFNGYSGTASYYSLPSRGYSVTIISDGTYWWPTSEINYYTSH